MNSDSIEMYSVANGTFNMCTFFNDVLCDSVQLAEISKVVANIDKFRLIDTSDNTDIAAYDEVAFYDTVQLRLTDIDIDVAHAIREPFHTHMQYLMQADDYDIDNLSSDLPYFDCVAKYNDNGKLTEVQLNDCYILRFQYMHLCKELILQLKPTNVMMSITV